MASFSTDSFIHTIHSLLLTGFTDFSSDMLVDIFNTLAFVWLRLTYSPDFGSHCSNLLLINTPYGYTGISFYFKLNIIFCFNCNRMGIANFQYQVFTFYPGTISNP